MKILVCLKQVPNQDARLDINAEATWIKEEGIKFEINEYDTYALEEALQMKDAAGEGEVVVVSIGPDRVTQSLRTALGMGADRAVHVKDPEVDGSDPLGVAKVIHAVAKEESPDFVFMGLMSDDSNSGGVGPMLAELMGVPSATAVMDVEQAGDGSWTQVARLALPDSIEGSQFGSSVALGDGIALVQVLLSLTDEFYDPARHDMAAPSDSAWNLVPSLFRPVLKSVNAAANTVLSTSESLLREGLTMALRPRHLFKRAKQGMSIGAALTKFALLSPDSDTSFKGELSVGQRAAWSRSIPLGKIKRIGKALDAKVNDVLLGAVAGALRHYLQAQDEPVDDVSIRALIPVNLRPLEQSFELGNRFGLVFLDLPIWLDDPKARVLEVKRQMDEIKASSEAVAAFGILEVLGYFPYAFEEQAVRIFSSKASAVMTNVPGPRQKLHLDGHQIQHIMPWVPRAGNIGLGVSIFSYAGDVRIGVACDAGLVPDAHPILDGFREEFDGLLHDLAPKANRDADRDADREADREADADGNSGDSDSPDDETSPSETTAPTDAGEE